MIDGGPIETVALYTESGEEVYPVAPNYGLQFNGVSTMVEIADDAAYSYGTTSELSIEAWIRPDVTLFPDTEGSGYVHWLSKVDTNANEWVFRMYSSDNTESRANRISFYLYSEDGLPQGDGVAFQENVIAGQWMHLIATVSSGKTMKYYKNGTLKNSFTTSLTLTDTTTPVRIGSGAQNANPNNRSYFKGSIKGVKTYNRELSSSEVAQAMNGELLTGITGWWPLTEGSGSTAYDLIGGNHGTISNATWVRL